MASASGQVSSSSQSLSEGSSEQAASIEETSSSLEEMSSMTRQNADNADQANNLMKEAQQGKYTTLVVGRRGLSSIKQFFIGSVSNKIVQLAKRVSLIVVD